MIDALQAGSIQETDRGEIYRALESHAWEFHPGDDRFRPLLQHFSRQFLSQDRQSQHGATLGNQKPLPGYQVDRTRKKDSNQVESEYEKHQNPDERNHQGHRT